MAGDDLWLPPTYRELADLIVAKIDSGEYPRGSILPSANELAREHQVSITTVHRAMRLLHETGLVVGRQGRGQYVAGRQK